MPYPSIPTSVRSSASFVAEPTPHLILPEPFAEYCLTPYFPDTRDYDQVKRLACLPSTVPYFGPKGPDDPKAEGIMRWTDRWWTGSGSPWPLQSGYFVADVQGYPMSELVGGLTRSSVIRRTDDVKTFDPSSPPDIIGCIGFEREHFANVPIDQEERTRRVADELAKPDGDGMWELNMLVVDPEHGKRGLMSAVFRHIMSIWLLPLVGEERRGFLGSAWAPSNAPSDKWHKRNGFRPLGLRIQNPDKPKESAYLAAIWMGFEGERAIEKEQTLYRDLPDPDGA